ncbi:MAG: polyprenyl synthetase family protein [Chitinophagaceae bacterium]|nr:polyprenyl synthetase family protein [Chitinophagaceae bacterium]
MRSIVELQQLFNANLKAQEFQGTPRELYEPFTYMLDLGGKRMRPVLLLHACELFGKDAMLAMPQALAVELFHNFSLIHDDIMDLAPIRRGVPTVHKKFNQTIAILSGDAMLVVAYKYLVQADQALLAGLLNVFNNCAIKVCEGQQLDMNFEKYAELNVADYLNMIELKTATLIAASLQLGAMIAGAGIHDAAHLYNFGKQLGISFQLKDDWLDSFGNTQKVGKQTGGDIIQNKKTFLLVEALNCSDAETKRQLEYWYQPGQFNHEEKVAAVLQLFNKSGISERTQQATNWYFEEALKHLEQLALPSKDKDVLETWARQILDRDY